VTVEPTADSNGDCHGETGETDLLTLLLTMEPVLHEGVYVYCTINRTPTPDEVATAIALVREDEGTTLVLSHEDATAMRLRYPSLMARITLTVHSSLAAVGLTAAVAKSLGDVGIPCNVIAGFHHDHIFVPADRARDAMEALRALSDRGS